MAHLFTYAGAPWLTQYWVRRVKEEAYGGTTPSTGYNGDEDQGRMGGVAITLGPRPNTQWGAVRAEGR